MGNFVLQAQCYGQTERELSVSGVMFPVLQRGTISFRSVRQRENDTANWDRAKKTKQKKGPGLHKGEQGSHHIWWVFWLVYSHWNVNHLTAKVITQTTVTWWPSNSQPFFFLLLEEQSCKIMITGLGEKKMLVPSLLPIYTHKRKDTFGIVLGHLPTQPLQRTTTFTTYYCSFKIVIFFFILNMNNITKKTLRSLLKPWNLFEHMQEARRGTKTKTTTKKQ